MDLQMKRYFLIKVDDKNIDQLLFRDGQGNLLAKLIHLCRNEENFSPFLYLVSQKSIIVISCSTLQEIFFINLSDRSTKVMMDPLGRCKIHSKYFPPSSERII